MRDEGEEEEGYQNDTAASAHLPSDAPQESAHESSSKVIREPLYKIFILVYEFVLTYMRTFRPVYEFVRTYMRTIRISHPRSSARHFKMPARSSSSSHGPRMPVSRSKLPGRPPSCWKSSVGRQIIAWCTAFVLVVKPRHHTARSNS